MSLKQVISLMATTPGADEFNTGVEYVVARESSCHCQFSAISLFCEKIKFLQILLAPGYTGALQHHSLPFGAIYHVKGTSSCTCQFSVMSLCDFVCSLLCL